MTTHDIGPGRCPRCGIALGRASGVGHAEAPRPGDISVCVGCAAVLVLDAGLAGREPTPAEAARLMASGDGPAVRAAVRAVLRAKAEGGGIDPDWAAMARKALRRWARDNPF